MDNEQLDQFEASDGWLHSFWKDDPHLAIVFAKDTIFYANPSSYKLLRLTSPDALIGLPFYQFVAVSFHRLLRELVEQLDNGRGVTPFHAVKLLCGDGCFLTVEIYLRAVVYARETAVLVIGREIINSQLAEKALFQNSGQFSLLHEIDQAILSSHSAQEIAMTTLIKLRKMVSGQRASLFLLDFARETAFVLAATGTLEMPGQQAGATIPISILNLEQILLNGNIFIVEDIDDSEQTVENIEALREAGIRAFAGIPLIVDQKLIGVIYLDWSEKGVFPSGSEEIVQDASVKLAIAIQQTRLFEAEKRGRLESETLRTVISALTTTIELDQLLSLILEQLANVLKYESASIFLLENDVLRGMACRGIRTPEAIIGKPFPVENKLFQFVRTELQPVFLSDATQDPRFLGWGDTKETKGWMGVPLTNRGEFIGYMTIDSYQIDAYGAEDVKRVQPFANQAAQAIENARLYNQSQHHAEELKTMLTKLQETQQQLVQQERLAAVGQLAAGIAHDFNNILAVIVLYSQLLQRTANMTMVEKGRLQTIVEQGERATRLIQQILDFSRKSIIERRPLSLPTFLAEIEKLLERTLPETIQITVSYDEDVYEIQADPTSIQQLLMNLALNARDAMQEGGKLHFKLHKMMLAPGDMAPVSEMHYGEWIVIRVEDSGIGMTPDTRKKIFEPFFTTKGPSHGTGLGLAQAYGIVRQHEGFIRCESAVGVGSKFFVYFPSHKSGRPEFAKRDTAVLQGTGQTVLVVEDNASALTVIEEILKMLNYEVMVAENGAAALTILQQNTDIAVVLSDVVMPEMGGFELVQNISEMFPHINIILMSGYTREQEQTFWSSNQDVAWLRKPFSIESLAELVYQALHEEE